MCASNESPGRTRYELVSSDLNVSFSLAWLRSAERVPKSHNPCTHSSMSRSFMHASDKTPVKSFLVPFVDPVYISWGVSVCFGRDLLCPCESRPLYSDVFLLIRQKHQRVSAVPDLCCFILFHQQQHPPSL